jgi:hypothetical protein
MNHCLAANHSPIMIVIGDYSPIMLPAGPQITMGALLRACFRPDQGTDSGESHGAGQLLGQLFVLPVLTWC